MRRNPDEYNSSMLRAPLLGQTIGTDATDFAVQETTEPGDSGPVAPLHLADDEAFYVLDGRLRIRLGDEEIEVPAGACALVPKGTPHTYWNPDATPVRYLLVLPPRLRRLVDAFDADPDRPEPEMRALFEAHDSELVVR